MNILRRYCFQELFIPFTASFAFLAGLFIVLNLVQLADLLVNKGVSLLDVFLLILLIIPSVIGLVLPFTVVMSILLVFGGFAQNNEVNAMKASGINLFRVVLPVIAASFLLSLVSLFLIDQVQPKAEYYSRQIIRNMIVKHPTAYVEPRRFIKDFKDYILWVNEVRGNRLEGITIFQSQEGKPTRTIMAEWGEVVSSKDDESFSLKLYNGTTDEPNPDDPSVLYKLNFKSLVLPDIMIGKESTGRGKKAKEMSIDELIYQLKRNEALKSGPAHDRRKFEGEIHRKISLSFGSLIFALFALPVALITRRGEAVVSFCIGGGLIAFYYVAFVWGMTMAVRGTVEPWLAMWIPNFVIMGIALCLIKYVFDK